MTANLQDHFLLAFWGAFVLFSLTAGSILSGAVIERIRTGAFLILATILGSFTWIWLASQAWSPWGWTLKWLGTHDAYASGIIYTIAGFFALGVLVNLGPRIGKFDAQGKPRDIPLHNQWMTVLGLFLIYTGFWGFYYACNIPTLIAWDLEMPFWGSVNIYGNPTTNQAIMVNFLMSLTGGLWGGYLISRGNPFWTLSGGLAGIIAASAGNDLYHPYQAFLLAFVTVPIIYKLHYWVERKFKIDDAVGAVAVHGYAGVLGLIWAGFLLWGYPTGGPPFGFDEIQGTTTPWGQLAVALYEAGWSFTMGLVVSYALKRAGLLRVPPIVEVAGLDLSSPAYGEQYPYFPPTPAKNLPEIEKVHYLELQKLVEALRRANGGKSLTMNSVSKDSGRSEYAAVTAEELPKSALRLQQEMEGEQG